MKDILTGIFCIVFSLFVFVTASTFPQSPKIYNSPAVYPQSLIILLIFLALTLIVSGILQIRKKPPHVQKPTNLSKPLWIFATLVGYLFLLSNVNFVIATFVFLIVIYRLLGGTWIAGAVFSVLLTVGEFIVFGFVLKVPLP